ncbi:hypothetical protein [Atopomonas sediminilitoris]|uniref:hypothetical protein n=1 Tax=Atopomonas sediminilitoris TaxID=2919919 RepID=UPI001F4EFF42|nr:hypothetical protein [Atopomonas sediminilitoris]MCJ8167753.1 hypothetical protein [Atopomonas sediminilitoris]
MDTPRTRNRHALTLTALFATLIAGTSPSQADPGDIVIQRQVQPRTLSQHWFTPDPNPTTVNPGVYSQEVSDADFAQVSSQTQRSLQPSTVQQPLNTLQQTVQHGTGTQQRSGNAASGNHISGSVNRAISQGLSPLRNLGGLAGGAQ